MKVTGYKFREALRRWQLRRDAASGQFKDALMKFPGEEKRSPEDIDVHIQAAEQAIASLQSLQAAYNLRVHVPVEGVSASMSLLECIKNVGGFERAVSMWSDAAKLKKERFSSFHESASLRDTTKVAAQRTISYEDAAKHAAHYDRIRAAYVEAMNVGNGTVVELENLPAALFE